MQKGKLPPYNEVMERRRKSKAIINWLCIIAVAVALAGVWWALS